jgi:serine/threonine-protein kinase
MSEVWRATDAVLGRTVAVKALSSPLAADPVLRAATWREARAAARLTHANVTQVYDYGEATMPGGAVVPYLVMEFVGGQNLADRLTRGPLSWPEATAIGAQVAAALAAAHRLGVVHRDVKPGNVMLTPSGAKVLDFGIAALIGAGGDTDAGWLVGTPAYTAPERLRPGPAQPASDVYALGVLLYEMMTGRQPIPARTWDQVAAAHGADVPVPPLDVPGLPRRVGRLALACLSADPDERPSAEELAVALAAVAGQPDPTPALPPADVTARLAPAGYAVGAAALPHPPTMVERAPLDTDVAGGLSRPPGRSRVLLIGVFGAVAALVLGAILVVAALQSGSRTGDGTAAPSGPSTAGPATSSAASPTSASPTALPQGRDQIIAALGQLIDAAGLPQDDAARLKEDLAALSSNRGKGNVRKKAAELEQDINRLMEDGRLDPATGTQLITLLQPLTATGGDEGD